MPACLAPLLEGFVERLLHVDAVLARAARAPHQLEARKLLEANLAALESCSYLSYRGISLYALSNSRRHASVIMTKYSSTPSTFASTSWRALSSSRSRTLSANGLASASRTFSASSPISCAQKRAKPNQAVSLISLRVRGQWLLGVAQDCNPRIDNGSFVPSIAHHCKVLRAG
jgi:hypothetical protein